jgi:hypothetical protein
MARAARHSIFSPFVLLRRNSLYKGLLGGDRTWVLVGAVVWLPRLVKKAFGRTPEVVTIEKLPPGQAIRIQAIPQVTRQQRRAIKRTS